jgi:hypothetical protein
MHHGPGRASRRQIARVAVAVGERTRLGCRRWRLAIANFRFWKTNLAIARSSKVRCGETPQPARRGGRSPDHLPRPARLGDLADAIEDFAFATRDRVEQIKSTALREDDVARIRAPNRIFSGRNDATAATT